MTAERLLHRLKTWRLGESGLDARLNRAWKRTRVRGRAGHRSASDREPSSSPDRKDEVGTSFSVALRNGFCSNLQSRRTFPTMVVPMTTFAFRPFFLLVPFTFDPRCRDASKTIATRRYRRCTVKRCRHRTVAEAGRRGTVYDGVVLGASDGVLCQREGNRRSKINSRTDADVYPNLPSPVARRRSKLAEHGSNSAVFQVRRLPSSVCCRSTQKQKK